MVQDFYRLPEVSAALVTRDAVCQSVYPLSDGTQCDGGGCPRSFGVPTFDCGRDVATEATVSERRTRAKTGTVIPAGYEVGVAWVRSGRDIDRFHNLIIRREGMRVLVCVFPPSWRKIP